LALNFLATFLVANQAPLYTVIGPFYPVGSGVVCAGSDKAFSPQPVGKVKIYGGKDLHFPCAEISLFSTVFLLSMQLLLLPQKICQSAMILFPPPRQ